MTPGEKGIVLGVIAAGVGAAMLTAVSALEGARGSYATLFGATTIASMPCAGIGSLLGHLAGRLTAFRRVILVALALAPVAALASLAGQDIVLLLAIPVVGFALALERWTRSTAPSATADSRVTVAEWPARVP